MMFKSSLKVGPGKVLTGLNKRISDQIIGISITEKSHLHEATNQLEDLSYIGE